MQTNTTWLGLVKIGDFDLKDGRTLGDTIKSRSLCELCPEIRLVCIWVVEVLMRRKKRGGGVELKHVH